MLFGKIFIVILETMLCRPNFHPNTIDYAFWTNFDLITIDYGFGKIFIVIL